LNRPGFKPRFKITDRMAEALARIERARGFLEAAKLSEAWLKDMAGRALKLEAHYTTHIEGTRLTWEQSEKLLSGGKVPGADPEDVRELLNYRRAFEFVSDYLGSGERVTEGLIREIHKKLVAGVRGGSARPGEYRKVQNYVVNSATGEVVYQPPPAMMVPAMMSELVAWLNREKRTHPVLVSGIAQYQLVHIHPFLDGNGRVSRLLSTLCLYRAGYDFKRLFTLSEYYDRDRPSFYRALQAVRERGLDLTGWLEYFTRGLATQLSEVKEQGERTLRLEAAARAHGLNARQARALGYLIEQGGMAIRDYEAMYPKVTRRTLQRDLSAMVRAGLVLEQGAGPAARYRLLKKLK